MQYRFGECRLDIESRQLLFDGVERPLAPKAFDLLRLLIECRPRVLTKAEIMDLVWPDTFVAESNLAVLVGDVRAAIGDAAAHARLIRTHHGVGYSFSGEVIEQSRSDRMPVGGMRFVLAIGTRRIVLPQGSLIVGRDIQCDIVVPDTSVSRRHARFDVSAANVELEDLQSKNGTLVNDKPLETKQSLTDGAAITFGGVTASLHHVGTSEGQSTVTL